MTESKTSTVDRAQFDFKRAPTRTRIPLVGLLAASIALTVRAQAPGPDELSERLMQSCPDAMKHEQATVDALARHQPRIERVARPALQHELLLMTERDQAARRQWSLSDDPNSDAVRATEAIDAHNQVRLRQILRQDGFPTARMVGYNGVEAAWLLLQHMGDDHEYQARWLPIVRVRAIEGDLNPASYALLADRVRLGQGQKQLYGSQYKFLNGQLVLFPIEDEAHLEQRRAKFNLVSEADYLCVSKAMQ